MQLFKDFAAFLHLLNRRQVEYMVVGGYALAAHGKPRYTGDLDIWINHTDTNAERVIQVLKDFGVSKAFRKEDFLKKGSVVQMGRSPLRIDIHNNINGVKFEEAMAQSEVIILNGLKVVFIGKEDFIRNKVTTGRGQDLVDVKEMRENRRE